jgi:hypothetical protein
LDLIDDVNGALFALITGVVDYHVGASFAQLNGDCSTNTPVKTMSGLAEVVRRMKLPRGAGDDGSLACQIKSLEVRHVCKTVFDQMEQ